MWNFHVQITMNNILIKRKYEKQALAFVSIFHAFPFGREAFVVESSHTDDGAAVRQCSYLPGGSGSILRVIKMKLLLSQ